MVHGDILIGTSPPGGVETEMLTQAFSAFFQGRYTRARRSRSHSVRMKRWFALGFTFCLAAGLGLSTRAAAQDDEVLMPDQSAAKAKQILQAGIDALGGQSYLNVHDVTCTGNIGQFDHSGDVTGFGKFIDYSIPPDKERQENLPKRNIIEVYNGNKGWVLDRGGVSEAPGSDLEEFQQDNLNDIDNILRHRIHETGMVFRYAGPDIVQLKQVDWVELTDNDNRVIRIAFAQSTRLPIEETVETRDPKTQLAGQETDLFSDYHQVQGIQTAFQLERDRNNMKIFQAFFNSCDYNTGLADSLFTRESLEERWAKVGKKERKKEAKEDKKDKNKDQNQNSSSNNGSSNGGKNPSSNPDW
jgi:hypothetical protein